MIIALQESLDSHIYNYLYIHFEITDDPCNLICSHWCAYDFRPNCTTLSLITIKVNQETKEAFRELEKKGKMEKTRKHK